MTAMQRELIERMMAKAAASGAEGGSEGTASSSGDSPKRKGYFDQPAEKRSCLSSWRSAEELERRRAGGEAREYADAAEWLANNGVRAQRPTTNPRSAHFAKVGRATRRQDILRLKREVEPVDAREWTAYITAMVRVGAYRDALGLFDQLRLRPLQLDVVAYNEAIVAYGKSGQWKHALSLLEELCRAPNVEPDLRSFSTAISACGLAEPVQCDEALRLFERARARFGEVDEYTYNAAMRACARGLQWERAMGLLTEMKEAARSGRGALPTLHSYNAAVYALSKCGQSERAMALLQQMRGVGVQPDASTYSAAITACAKDEPNAGRVHLSAQWLLDDMQRHRVAHNQYTYNAAMKACANDGQWKAALELLDRMERKERLKADACSYHACIVACKNGGEWHKCLQLL